MKDIGTVAKAQVCTRSPRKKRLDATCYAIVYPTCSDCRYRWLLLIRQDRNNWPDSTVKEKAFPFKGGAEGLLCAARDGVGIALKAEDGSQRPLGPALDLFLAALGFDSGDLGVASIVNSRGEAVGEIRVTS